MEDKIALEETEDELYADYLAWSQEDPPNSRETFVAFLKDEGFTLRVDTDGVRHWSATPAVRVAAVENALHYLATEGTSEDALYERYCAVGRIPIERAEFHETLVRMYGSPLRTENGVPVWPMKLKPLLH